MNFRFGLSSDAAFDLNEYPEGEAGKAVPLLGRIFGKASVGRRLAKELERKGFR